MAPAKKSVDDIWKALNSNSLKSKKANDVLAVMNRETCSSKSRTTTVKTSDQWQSAATESGAGAKDLTTTEKPTAAAILKGFEGSIESLRSLMQRDLNCLLEKSARTRQRALERVEAVAEADFELELSQELLAEATATLFVKPLLRRFEDPVEKCRGLAITTLHRLVDRSEAYQELLPYVIPVIGERLCAIEEGKPEMKEPSEEIRFQLVKFLYMLMEKAEASISPYAQDVHDIVIATSLDTCPEVLEVLCECCVLLSTALARRLEPLARKMLFAITPVFENKRSKVRVAVLKAVGALMHTGPHETILDLSSFQHPNIVQVKAFYGDYQKVNWFGKMAMDQSAAVREQFVRMQGDWIVNLWERVDHESRLIPYVIGGLADEAPRVVKAALEQLQLAGDQYEKEKKEDLKDVVYYGQDFLVGADGAYLDGSPLSYLPPQIGTARPSLGVRRVVSENCSRLLYPLLKELEAWQSDNKKAAANLIHMLFVYSEKMLNKDMYRVVPSFCKIVNDPEIEDTMLECCRVMGRFTEPSFYWRVLVQRLAPDTDNKVRIGALKVLRKIAEGSAIGTLDHQVPELLEIFLGEDILKTHQVALKMEALDLVDMLISVCAEPMAQHSRDCVIILSHLATPVANSDASEQLLSKTWRTLERMAEREGMSAADLISVFRPKMISALAQCIDRWTAFETEHLLFLTSSLAAMAPGQWQEMEPLEMAALSQVLGGVLPHMAPGSQARLLKSVEFVAHGSKALQASTGAALMGTLNEHLGLRTDDAAVRAGAAEGLYPALDGARNLLTRALLPEPVVAAHIQAWSKRWAAALGDLTADVALREHMCDLLGCAMDAYGALILPSGGKVDKMVCRAVLERVHDSSDGVRVAALGLALKIVALTQGAGVGEPASPRLLRQVAKAVRVPSLAEEASAQVQESLGDLLAMLDACPTDDASDDDDGDEGAEDLEEDEDVADESTGEGEDRGGAQEASAGAAVAGTSEESQSSAQKVPAEDVIDLRTGSRGSNGQEKRSGTQQTEEEEEDDGMMHELD